MPSLASAWSAAFRAYLERPGVACVALVLQLSMLFRRLLSCSRSMQKTDSPRPTGLQGGSG